MEGDLRENSFAVVSSCAWISTPTVNSHIWRDASSFSLRCLFWVLSALASCLSCFRRGTRSEESVAGTLRVDTAENCEKCQFCKDCKFEGRVTTRRLTRSNKRPAPRGRESIEMDWGESGRRAKLGSRRSADQPDWIVTDSYSITVAWCNGVLLCIYLNEIH